MVGATVYWKGTTQGVATDDNGRFSIDRHVGADTLVVSFISYTSQYLVPKNGQKLAIVLHSDSEVLNDVTVVVRDKGTHLSRVNPIQSVKLSGAELCKAACCNLSESFTTNPSVDVSYADAATGAKQIRLLGLSNLYIQMMAENMPAFRGLASIYGMEYVPGPWMESIQISKGTASVINGYEAIAGQVNVEYKKPESSELFFVNGYLNSELKTELNVNSSFRLNEKLATMILGHFKDGRYKIDHNDDGFLDLPLIRQYNFINRWSYKTDNYVAQYGAKVIDESRESGQMAFYNGNPSAYSIDIETRRYEFFTKQALIFNPETGHSLALQGSGSYHKQNSVYGSRSYNARQNNAYLNLIYQNYISANPVHQISTGVSLMYDDYDESLGNSDYQRTETVPGVFAQYTYNLNDKLVLLAGIRADHHNDYNLFFTPRVHAKYNVSEQFHLRASAGMGYRSANVLAENSYLLASSRKVEIADGLEQEKALNSGLNATYYFNLFNREGSFSADYYYTHFYQQVVTDTDSDPHQVLFYNLNGRSYSQSVQAEITWEALAGLDITAAFRVNDVKTTIGGELREKALTSRYKGLLAASYQTPLKKWQVDFTSQFNGGGRMPDPGENLWEPEFNPFTVINAQVTKYFKKWSVYVGGENLTNFKMHMPIIDAGNPWGNNFDASMTWGPVAGTMFYAGFRFALERK